jgi:hypothetical protein
VILKAVYFEVIAYPFFFIRKSAVYFFTKKEVFTAKYVCTLLTEDKHWPFDSVLRQKLPKETKTNFLQKKKKSAFNEKLLYPSLSVRKQTC